VPSETKSGRAAALEVIRHHRLLETYLSRALGIPWDRVHQEAEKLEHVLSEYLESSIDAYLGHPSSDPHASPIPSADGTIREPERLHLSDLPAGSSAVVLEVDDREPAVLTRLGEVRLGVNTRFQVLDVEPIDGLITLRVAGQSTCWGRPRQNRSSFGKSKDHEMSESHPRLQAAAREAIGGQRRGLLAVLPFIGPAFIASIAYIDPGNFATNIQGGA
jgi:hypothetical protein